jgi:hypothetical protein
MADRDTQREVRAVHDEIVKKLTDSGKLIEAGFVLFRSLAIPEGASEAQTEELRMAFMAGAQHLFGSIMGMLDAETEPTDDDMRRMDLIANELELYGQALGQRIDTLKSRGNA